MPALNCKRTDLLMIAWTRASGIVYYIYEKRVLEVQNAATLVLLVLDKPDAAAADINAFINAETRGKIPKLIEPSFVKDAKMVLTNAVYFKGFWKYPFKPQRTHKDKFFVTPEEYVQVDMMTQTGRFKYVDSEKLHAQVLEMPTGATPCPWWCFSRDMGEQGGGQAGPTPEAQETRVCGEGDALRPADSQVSQISVESTLGDELISYKKRNPGKPDVNLCWTSRWWLKGKLARVGFLSFKHTPSLHIITITQ
nr:putative serpin-Z12 [Penaeus vannamei]